MLSNGEWTFCVVMMLIGMATCITGIVGILVWCARAALAAMGVGR